MRRKRRCQNGDYDYNVWPRGKPVLQVAMAVEPVEAQEDEKKTLRIVFHGVSKLMLRHVFGLLRGRLFEDFSLTDEMMPAIINGKCYRSMTILIEQPDFHRLSLNEWPTIIKSMMERRFRCEVTYFDNYEKFLNA